MDGEVSRGSPKRDTVPSSRGRLSLLVVANSRQLIWQFLPSSCYLLLPLIMNSLSRREEDTLLKATKARAMSECDDLLKREFPRCSHVVHPFDVFVAFTRIRCLCVGSHCLCSVGLQRQPETGTKLHGSIVRFSSSRGHLNTAHFPEQHRAGTHGSNSQRIYSSTERATSQSAFGGPTVEQGV